MKLPFKSALVTGGAGFIGSHLVEALISSGCRVAVIDNLSSGKYANLEHLEGQFSFYPEDICNRPALDAAIENCEVVFHLAAVVSVPQTIKDPVDSTAVNNMGTIHVLDAACRKSAKRVVFSSSCAVYGNDPSLPKREDMNPKPLSPYAAQKLAAEYYAKVFHDLYDIETVVLRYFNVYGPRQDPSSPYSGVISIFMTKALGNVRAIIYGDGNQSRDFIYVQDVVRANLLAATSENPGGQTINIGSGNSVTINELWKEVCALCGRSLEPRYAGKRRGDIAKSVAGVDKARIMLGFECEVSFKKGLELTFEWYRSQSSGS